jgi:RES domain-containing protein
LQIFRLARRDYLNEHKPFAGEGAFLGGCRWCTPRHHLSLWSTSEALVTLEFLAHLGDRRLCRDAMLVVAEIDAMLVERLDRRKLPRRWDQRPPGIETQRLGDAWLAGLSAVALRVPSVLSASEENVVVNSNHPDVARISLIKVESWKLDARPGH